MQLYDKMIQRITKFDDFSKENIKEHNPNWPKIPDYACRILIIRGFVSGETISLFNLISHQPDIDNIYLYAKDPYEAKYKYLISKEKYKLKAFKWF